MLLILLTWIYIAFVFFSLGIACVGIIEKVLPKGPDTTAFHKNLVPFSMLVSTGMVFTTIIGSVLSLFFPLSYGANIFLLLLAAIIMFSNKQKAMGYLHHYKFQLSSTHPVLVIFFIAFALV